MRYNKINLMLPTYKRVKNGKLPRFISSCITNTGSFKNVCITFLVDNDDSETIFYIEHLQMPIKWDFMYWRGKQPHLGKMYNQIYERTIFRDEGTLVSMVADDMEWKTSGYDIAILNAINKCDGIGLVYCNDGFQGKKLCVNLFTSRKYVERTRMPFMCELFPAYFIDTVWMRVAKKTKTVIYLDDVLLKHHHASFNKKNIDVTYRRLQKLKKSFKKGYKEVDNYVNKIINNMKVIS